QRAQWEEHLSRGISSDQGVDLFERGLCAEWSRIVITPYDLSTPISVAPTREPAATAEEVGSSKSTSPAGSSKPASGSSTELVLVQIWSELLGNPKVGIHDDFFQLGGHSLLATRMMARIEDSFGTSISLRDVFDAPTVHQLSQRIDAAKSNR